MKKLILMFISMLAVSVSADAESLSLDSCRARALRSNKQLQMARVKQGIAVDARKAVRTKYLPHIDVSGGYLYSSREVSILNDNQKNVLSNMGTIGMGPMKKLANDFGNALQSSLGSLMEKSIITEEEALKIGAVAQKVMGIGEGLSPKLAEALNEAGQEIVDAFSTNTHHIFAASAMLTQPIYLGGALTAANNIADITEKMSAIGIENASKDVVYNVDNAYWTVVSLRQKQKLADGYLSLVKKLSDDVNKMIKEGVATKADGLKVDVAVNEADMTKAKVDNGLSLAKMYLCLLCGMDINSDITLTDENMESSGDDAMIRSVQSMADADAAVLNPENRTELQLLSHAIDITKEHTKIARAGHLPTVALTGGVLFSSPSVYNGFERKFKGAATVGVAVNMPILDWGETSYKIRAAKNATNLAELAYSEAEELMQLQVNQNKYKVREANKHYVTACKNTECAEENLRCANVGFREGVMQSTDVMAAQTAWLKAQTEKIDAEIEIRLSEIALNKALGR